jgi:hypothetical protein
VVMATRLVHREVPQMSDRSATTLVSVGRSPRRIFEAWKVREISNARAPVTETPKRLFLV